MEGWRILVVDGNPAARGLLRSALAQRGQQAMEAGCLAEALEQLGEQGSTAVVVAASLPDGSAAELVRRVRARRFDVAFVVTCVRGESDAALEAMRAGAEACLAAPAHVDLAAALLEKALEKPRLRRESAELRRQALARCVLLGNAQELQAARDLLRRAAPTKATVLVVGQAGTGKSLAAEVLHQASPRRDGPLVRLSCAALSVRLLEAALFGPGRGAVARAEGGTLHLAEVERLPQALQARLLRMLQQGEYQPSGRRETLPVDVRLVASTRRDLAEEVRAARFREDLYYRLSVVTVALPPLQLRRGDLPALAEHFLGIYGRRHGKAVRSLTPGALSALFAYDWPGNVRELENVMERAVRRCGGRQVGLEDLPPVLRGARAEERGASGLIPGASLFEIEREAILRALDHAGGSTARAAGMLGISVRKVQYRLKEYRTGRPQGARQRALLAEAAGDGA